MINQMRKNNMYEEEFDNLKTKMLKYIMYKKRTERFFNDALGGTIQCIT